MPAALDRFVDRARGCRVTSRQFIRWSRLHERRARRGFWNSPWLIALVAGGALAAFVWWRASEAGPIAGSRAWLAGSLAAFALAFMRVPFHLYWRPDAALLAQLPIGGGALFDAALMRCLRAAIATMVVALIGAAPLAALDAEVVSWVTRSPLTTPIAGPRLEGLSPIELFVRHAAMTGVFGLLAGGFLPAVASWAASLVARGGRETASSARTTIELATELAGAPVREQQRQGPGSDATILGALPGFAATVVIVLVIIAAPWLYNRSTALPAVAVLGGLAGASVLAILAMRASAPRVMGIILRDVSALDRQRLATLEIRPPTALEKLIAGMLGDAALPYRKDARLMRRRYPMAFALGALCFLVLVIIGLSRPVDPIPWLVAILAGVGMYATALAGRLRRPPIELPRLAATLPITAAARTRGKVAWVVSWLVVFVIIPLAFATVRLL